jgi:hypothetical protein
VTPSATRRERWRRSKRSWKTSSSDRTTETQSARSRTESFFCALTSRDFLRVSSVLSVSLWLNTMSKRTRLVK